MNQADRRRYARIEIENPVWCKWLDEDRQTISQGMGRALNICRAGLLLETVHAIKAKYISLNTVDTDNNVVKIKSKIVYCRKNDSGVYQCGISLVASQAEMDEFAIKMVRLHQYIRDESRAVSDAL